MKRRKIGVCLSVLLTIAMLLGTLLPITAYAADTEAVQTAPVSEYSSFISSLKELEVYADSYAASSGEDALGLVLNYIRTGIEKYNSDSWAILAGAENTAFTAFVKQQDEANRTNAQGLRGIEEFVIPNGQELEFSHMFGAISVAYYNSYATVSWDFGSWAGDICDLMIFSKDQVSSTDVESLTTEIRENYLGVDDPVKSAFGFKDIYGDLDAYYILSKLSGGEKQLSSVVENYFTSSLTDNSRAVYFLTNRFDGSVTKEAIRSAIYNTYKNNSGVTLLEAERGLTNDENLRMASCYAFADYLYDLAKSELVGQNEYYTVFSSTKSTVAPGVTQNIKYAVTADDKQIVYYIATVDIARDDVTVCANYMNNDGSVWGMSRVTDQMAAAQAKHSDPEDAEHYIENYNAVAGINGDFYNMTTGQPSGALVMEGVIYQDTSREPFFAILKDGTPMIGSASEWNTYKDQVQEAVSGSIFLLKDGQVAINASSDYYNSRAPRTSVGITADGKVVFMALDGRQEPFSAGGSVEEIAQIMLDAGCIDAINLDGGGSTTYAAKAEGSDEICVINRPSDGYERSVSTSLLVVSTAKTSNEFDHAILTTDTDYLTVGANLEVTVSGVSESGNAAEVPADAVLRVSDESIATLTDGVVTAVANGDVNIELVIGDTVVGSKALHVVVPDALTFEKASMNVVYGVPTRLPLKATYLENPVTICEDDILTGCEYEEAGIIDGFMFTGIEESGIRTMTVAAMLAADESEEAYSYCEIRVSMYKNGEAIFDFENADYGDGSFAWNRDVTNSESSDGKYYHIADVGEEMNISYVFALDMTEIEIPEQIKPLISLLPGGDSADATAWDFLLQLAERVSVMTEVRINFHTDPNLDFDFSGLTLVNEYFTLSSAEYDEDTHTFSIVCNWIDQTQAIDPATANPICILSGIKAAPKADAAWDENSCLSITNTGDVSYDIYLRSSNLYSISSDTSVQETYGVYPFVNPNDETEKGGHFGTTYATFEDSFILDSSAWQGWKNTGDSMYYYENNAKLTGIHSLPDSEGTGNTYYYSFDENGVCTGKVSGLFEIDGGRYYALNGELKTGWWFIPDSVVGDSWYYFSTSTGRGINGITAQFFENVVYEFDNGRLIHGTWYTNASGGTRYYYGPGYPQGKWYTVDGDRYYFDGDGYRYEGYRYVKEANNHDDNTYWYDFGDDGACRGVYEYTGLLVQDGKTYYINNGVAVYGLALAEDGYYYYFSSADFTAVKNTRHWISYPNDTGIAPAFYDFDENGRMIMGGTDPIDPDPVDPDPVDPDPDLKNGIVNEDGTLYYYVNGVKTYAGLIQIDGYYYYVNSSCKVVTNAHYWISKTNGLLPATFYDFDENGRMIMGGTDPIDPDPVDPDPVDPDPDLKNGIVNEDGTLYYYVNGVKTYAGLIQIDGYYYYVNSSCKVVTNAHYWISKTNGLLPATFYDFDENGRMITESINPDPVDPDPGLKNGIVNEDGTLYYYVNGVKTYAGLIQIDGYYYYVNSSCKVVTNAHYWISKTNGLLPATFYDFDENGRMIMGGTTPTDPDPVEPDPDVKNGIVNEDGTLYYYENGVKTYGGLIQIDGDYYYVNSSCKVVTNAHYWISKTNGLLPATFYDFDKNGKLLLP